MCSAVYQTLAQATVHIQVHLIPTHCCCCSPSLHHLQEMAAVLSNYRKYCTLLPQQSESETTYCMLEMFCSTINRRNCDSVVSRQEALECDRTLVQHVDLSSTFWFMLTATVTKYFFLFWKHFINSIVSVDSIKTLNLPTIMHILVGWL